MQQARPGQRRDTEVQLFRGSIVQYSAVDRSCTPPTSWWKWIDGLDSRRVGSWELETPYELQMADRSDTLLARSIASYYTPSNRCELIFVVLHAGARHA